MPLVRGCHIIMAMLSCCTNCFLGAPHFEPLSALWRVRAARTRCLQPHGAALNE